MQIVSLKISFLHYSVLTPTGRGGCLQGAILKEGAAGKRRETASRFPVQAKTAESTSLACKTEAACSCAVSVINCLLLVPWATCSAMVLGRMRSNRQEAADSGATGSQDKVLCSAVNSASQD